MLATLQMIHVKDLDSLKKLREENSILGDFKKDNSADQAYCQSIIKERNGFIMGSSDQDLNMDLEY